MGSLRSACEMVAANPLLWLSIVVSFFALLHTTGQAKLSWGWSWVMCLIALAVGVVAMLIFWTPQHVPSFFGPAGADRWWMWAVAFWSIASMWMLFPGWAMPGGKK